MPEQSKKTIVDLAGIEELEEDIGKLAQTHLAYFREVHNREQRLTEETLWIHVVHGTWANPENSKVRPAWSEPGGSLERALRSYGNPDLWEKVRFANVPSWSGTNSFGARSQAMKDLTNYFHDVLHDPKKTFGRHLVIAHSHGGTVAAEALRNLGPLAREFLGLLTLGTPFIQRVRMYNESTFDMLTGMFAPAVAMFFSLSIAIAAALEKFFGLAGWWLVYACIPAILCRFKKSFGIGWALCSVTPALALVFFWLALGIQNWGDLVASSIVAVIPTLYFCTKSNPRLNITALDASDCNSEEQLPKRIEVPLLAIRAPGDEASLAISAAASAIFLSDTIRGVVSKLYSRIPEKWLMMLGLPMGIGLVLTVLSGFLWQDSWPAAKYVRFAALIAFLGPYTAFSFVLILILAIKFTAVTLMAIACGWEAFEAPGLIRIYAEPLPRSREPMKGSMTLRMTFPTIADLDMMRKSSSLRHSIYEYPSVQEYLTFWIMSFFPLASKGKGNAA